MRLACAAALVFLAGCTPRPPEPQLVASPDKVTLMLTEAADKASTALQTLAAVEQARTPNIAVGTIPNPPPELRRAMTVSWIGPAEQISAKLAGRAGYTFMTIGSPPPSPLVVNIDAENKPVIDILRDVGLQLGRRADIKVDANTRSVELHYTSDTSMNFPG
jgi:defect-in-organelle-trafficking protein DotD